MSGASPKGAGSPAPNDPFDSEEFHGLLGTYVELCRGRQASERANESHEGLQKVRAEAAAAREAIKAFARSSFTTTLRDFFAAHALAGWSHDPGLTIANVKTAAPAAAVACFTLADAMLVQRKAADDRARGTASLLSGDDAALDAIEAACFGDLDDPDEVIVRSGAEVPDLLRKARRQTLKKVLAFLRGDAS